MKTADKRELKLQTFALHKLGFSLKSAAKMVVSGYRSRQQRLEKAEILKAAAAVKKPAIAYLLRLRKSQQDAPPEKPKKKDTQDNPTMEKSTKLNSLIEKAKADPSKLSQETLEHLNRHLTTQGQEPITKALPFGQSALSAAMTASRYNNLTGHQQSALRAGLSPDEPGIEGMSFPQMQELASQKQLQQVNTQRGLSGLPPFEPAPEKNQSASYLAML